LFRRCVGSARLIVHDERAPARGSRSPAPEAMDAAVGLRRASRSCLGGEFNASVRERRRLRAAAAKEDGRDLFGVVPGGHVPAAAQDEFARGRWNRAGASDEPVVIRPGERERD
jgi:hypothetical protein